MCWFNELWLDGCAHWFRSDATDRIVGASSCHGVVLLQTLFGTLGVEDLSCSGVLVGGSEPNGSKTGREVAAVTAMVDVFGWAIAIGWSHVETAETAAGARTEVLESAAFEVAGVGANVTVLPGLSHFKIVSAT